MVLFLPSCLAVHVGNYRLVLSIVQFNFYGMCFIFHTMCTIEMYTLEYILLCTRTKDFSGRIARTIVCTSRKVQGQNNIQKLLRLG